jgi:hypothetical protein
MRSSTYDVCVNKPYNHNMTKERTKNKILFFSKAKSAIDPAGCPLQSTSYNSYTQYHASFESIYVLMNATTETTEYRRTHGPDFSIKEKRAVFEKSYLRNTN